MPFPLWKTLTLSTRKQLARDFQCLAPLSISQLELETHSLLLQWMLENDHIEATSIAPIPNGIEIELHDTSEQRPEYLRFYHIAPPVNIVYDMLETMKGKDYKKARLYSLTAISENQKHIGKEFPLFFEILDGDKIISRLADVQRQNARRDKWERGVASKSKLGKKRKRTSSSYQSAHFMGLTSSQILLAGSLMLLAISLIFAAITFNLLNSP
ncbi:MAG: hypothetical protein HZB52_12695 [Chloroflexi bacterium]|nr:hypothetical protein [Chloroflexota bacterium]